MTVVNDRPRSLTFGHSAYCNIIPNVMPPCNIVVMPVDGVLTRKITRLNIGSLKAFIYVFKLMHDNCSNLCHKYSINIVGLYKVSLCYNLPRQSSIFSKCPFLLSNCRVIVRSLLPLISGGTAMTVSSQRPEERASL